MISDGSSADARWMSVALNLARRGLGRTAPNPSVGAVIIGGAKSEAAIRGHVVGRGWTQPGGRPHAEMEALRRAGGLARGSTLYVTLEPCCHYGETPPCVDALIDAGISRVVVAVQDPDPRVHGRGLAKLKDAGIAITEGVKQAEASALNEGFFLCMTAARPLFTWKTATTLDGRIATAVGDSRWITGVGARAVGHVIRAEHDGVLTGVGTVLADDPMLTSRLPGLSDRSPVRIVADSRLRLPLDSALVRTARDVPTWVVTGERSDSNRRHALEARDVEVLSVVTTPDGRPAPAAMAGALASRGLTRVLLECGGGLAASFLAADLIDRIAWFRAPAAVGGDAVSALAFMGFERIAEAPRFVRQSCRRIGEDVLETMTRSR